MEQSINTPKNHWESLDEKTKKMKIQSQIILFWSKVFAVLFWHKKNISLSQLSQNYLENTGTRVVVSEKSKSLLDRFCSSQKWIIFLDHTSYSNLSDYLPFFAQISEDILSQCKFYTWSWSIEMNKKLFPNYIFRWANPIWKSQWTELIRNILEDIDEINNNGWFIFLIPSWSGKGSEMDFKGVAERFLWWVENNIPVLSVKVSQGVDYTTILQKSLIWKIGKVDLQIWLSSVADWKWKSPSEMREYQNQLLET